MSNIIANRWLDSNGFNKTYVSQIVSTTTTTFSSTSSQSLGSTSGMNSAPTSTSGVSILTTSFQPRYADSKLLIKSSTIGFAETSNVTDDFRLFVHADSTLLVWNSSGLMYFTSANANQNFGLCGVQGMVNSWGTSSRTIRLGVDTNGSGSNFRYNYRDVSSWQPAPISLTITEILV